MMRWYKFYFKVRDNFYDSYDLEPDFWHTETMGIKAKNKEDAIKEFWSNIPNKHKQFYKLEEVEEGRLEEKITKPTQKENLKAKIERLHREIEALDEKYHFSTDDVEVSEEILDLISKKIEELETLQRMVV